MLVIGQMYAYYSLQLFKIVGYLKKQFKTPQDAEAAYLNERRQSGDDNRGHSGDDDERRVNSNSIMLDPSSVEHQFFQFSGTIQLDLLSK